MRLDRIILLGAAALAPISSAAAAPSAANGRSVFHSAGCYECHNYQGQGGTGPRLTAVNFDRLKAYVRAANGNMPPYRPSVLSDEEIADIFAYLQSVPKPPPADSIPAIRNLKAGPR
jgi:ubiquinol-cytochrome c reductase cytochrome c subunit